MYFYLLSRLEKNQIFKNEREENLNDDKENFENHKHSNIIKLFNSKYFHFFRKIKIIYIFSIYKKLKNFKNILFNNQEENLKNIFYLLLFVLWIENLITSFIVKNIF